jgi:hypothetical protein
MWETGRKSGGGRDEGEQKLADLLEDAQVCVSWCRSQIASLCARPNAKSQSNRAPGVVLLNTQGRAPPIKTTAKKWGASSPVHLSWELHAGRCISGGHRRRLFHDLCVRGRFICVSVLQMWAFSSF